MKNTINILLDLLKLEQYSKHNLNNQKNNNPSKKLLTCCKFIIFSSFFQVWTYFKTLKLIFTRPQDFKEI